MSRVEEWRPIPDWEGIYDVSDLGRVKSLERVVMRGNGWKYTVRERILKLTSDKDGYPGVGLCMNGRAKHFLVHRLVLLAFVGLPPPGHEGCHEDNNPGNPRLSNLRWDTSAGNQADKIKHGTSYRGERHGSAKLNENNVHEIRRRIKTGETQPSIASSFGVTPATVGDIKSGYTWGWLQTEKKTAQRKENAQRPTRPNCRPLGS